MRTLYLLFICIAFLTSPSAAFAQFVLSNPSDVTFGSIAFSTSYSGSLRLGTDGNLTIIGSGMVSSNDSQAGHVIITSPDSGIVEIKCRATGQMIAPGATTLDIVDTEISVDTPQVFGSGDACGGTTGASPVAATVNLATNPDPDIFIGGRINIPGPITLPGNVSYSSIGGGQAITLSFTLQ